jgi:hypothetical protein
MFDSIFEQLGESLVGDAEASVLGSRPYFRLWRTRCLLSEMTGADTPDIRSRDNRQPPPWGMVTSGAGPLCLSRHAFLASEAPVRLVDGAVSFDNFGQLKNLCILSAARPLGETCALWF